MIGGSNTGTPGQAVVQPSTLDPTSLEPMMMGSGAGPDPEPPPPHPTVRSAQRQTAEPDFRADRTNNRSANSIVPLRREWDGIARGAHGWAHPFPCPTRTPPGDRDIMVVSLRANPPTACRTVIACVPIPRKDATRSCRFRSDWGRCPTVAWDRNRVCPRILTYAFRCRPRGISYRRGNGIACVRGIPRVHAVFGRLGQMSYGRLGP